MAKQLDLKDNSLHDLLGEPWGDRRVERLNLKRIDFRKLQSLSEELNSKLHDKEFVNKNLHIFGENYEHNTDDGLLKVLGWNENNYKIETGNLVGYVSTPQFKLNISSRFGDAFLKYLLYYSEGFLEIPDTGTNEASGLYQWVMVFLWKTALKRAYRFGIPKQYVPQHEKLFTIKGNVDVLNYAINKNKDGKTLCNFYHYDYNNPVTQLISNTFSNIDNKELINDCIQLKNTFDNCAGGQRIPLATCLNTKHISNPYYSEYNKVIDLSKNILRRRFGDITDSSSISSAFLFDMSMLFEHYIRKVLKKEGFNLFPKNEDSMTISRGLGQNDDRHLYPDIVIDRCNNKKGEHEIEVYDVKYKHFNLRYGVKREDLFQLHTYVLYLSNRYKVTRCGIIYPQLGDSTKDTYNIIQHSAPEYNDGVPFRVLFINIPMTESNNMKIFNDEMKKMEKEFVRKMKE